MRRGATVASFHADGLGSVVALSEDGTELASYRYDAFGVPSASGSFAGSNTYTYTGRELDASGLYYYRARYYLPSIGRFLTPDPIGLAGGVNPYVYVGSNPVNFTDPFGLAPLESYASTVVPSPTRAGGLGGRADPSPRVETGFGLLGPVTRGGSLSNEFKDIFELEVSGGPQLVTSRPETPLGEPRAARERTRWGSREAVLGGPGSGVAPFWVLRRAAETPALRAGLETRRSQANSRVRR